MLFVLVAAVSATISGIVLMRALRHEIVDQLEDRLLIASRKAVGLLAAEADLPARADALADALGRDLSARVTVISGSGVVLGDSGLDPAALLEVENHAGREEVAAALRGEVGRATRHSVTLADDLLYLAVPIDAHQPSRGAVRLAIPLSAVTRAVARVRPLVIGASLLSILIAGAAGWLAARSPALRLSEMTRAATEIAAGRLGARARPGGDDEVTDLAHSLNRMAGQLEERLTLLARERRQLRTILDGMVEGVLLLDADGRIVLANEAYARIFSAQEPVVGRRLMESARLPALQEAVVSALASEAPVFHEITLSSDPERVISTSLAAVREGGRVVGAVAVFHDVTEIRRLERVRREFVANVSHELRTPLTAIKGYAETLLGGGLQEPQRTSEFVEVIARHAERLRRLIEDLLDLASIEQGEVHLEAAPVEVGEVVTQAEAVLRPAAERKGQTVSVSIPEGLQVLADRDRLAQVLINLMDNAVKFTPTGGRVEVAARASDGRVSLTVSDTGIGIPAGEQSRIFERFHRVDRSRDRREGGTGLGLAIAKHLTQAMDGTIEVESRAGFGTTFRITLPAA